LIFSAIIGMGAKDQFAPAKFAIKNNAGKLGSASRGAIAGEAGECSCNTCTPAIHGGRARSYKTLPIEPL